MTITSKKENEIAFKYPIGGIQYLQAPVPKVVSFYYWSKFQ